MNRLSLSLVVVGIIGLSALSIVFLLDWHQQVMTREVEVDLPSAWEYLQEEEDFSEFVALLEVAGGQEVLNFEAQEITLFVPSNTAFDNLSIEEREKIFSNQEAALDLIKSHVISGKLLISDLGNQAGITSLTDKSYVVEAPQDFNGLYKVGGQIVSISDIKIESGVMHRVGGILDSQYEPSSDPLDN